MERIVFQQCIVVNNLVLCCAVTEIAKIEITSAQIRTVLTVLENRVQGSKIPGKTNKGVRVLSGDLGPEREKLVSKCLGYSLCPSGRFCAEAYVIACPTCIAYATFL